ncbi:DUF1801 domain-containing protein [Sphingomonas koreensis]|jgi:hypothetical protein|uniref:DUF1801 domain-containing protein n=1 Tax=Sphingomonas koreensis TaxID=93064 RepID=A0A1L6JG35_9SPHN|nr:DUF1801 domain-containing protein [Sphingomonas koreensis]APR54896.1 hypothetical protein BRX40_08150 [Sphingomonas koreensis]MDC7811565.1 DUF1801 domain-containing protein [Sphingomonas koreensis]RSU19874.1 DUF1801 domain-containing protein [Sphingomonas koreensis]RSU26661.1 DUF1801 domain-containing protein [Sphingomonas koreensis]RSU27442.1 DUF1801 domain-containing protein [Sphingomonas koreensis]
MAEIKTKPTQVTVDDFIAAVENPVRREEAKAVCAMMGRVTGAPPVMWGPSIIGFGSYRYRYDSGHEGTMCRLGFSPRRAQLVLYILTEDPGQGEQLARLGKHKTGKSCLYINKLADVDMSVLEEMTRGALAHMNAKYPA